MGELDSPELRSSAALRPSGSLGEPGRLKFEGESVFRARIRRVHRPSVAHLELTAITAVVACLADLAAQLPAQCCTHVSGGLCLCTD